MEVAPIMQMSTANPEPTPPWLELDEDFEGVGAHHSNPRYDPVDEDGFDDVTGEPIPGWTPPDASS